MSRKRARQHESESEPAADSAAPGEPGLGSLVLSLVLGLGLSVIVIYAVLTHRTLSESDFELVRATPTSVVVESSGKRPYVELRLPDDPIRYRIGVERFGDFDDPAGFVQAASVHGAELTFHIERGARENPSMPMSDPKPTVFIESMAVGSRSYYALAQRIDWNEKNQGWARILAVVFPLLTLFMARWVWLRRRELKSLGKMPPLRD